MSSDRETAQNNPVELTKKLFIGRKGIGFFKAILESYEDVAIFSVLDGKSGLIELIYPYYFEKDIMAILDDMKNYGIVTEEAANA